MAKPENVRLREPTPGPDQAILLRRALEDNPDQVVVLKDYSNPRSAREAAGRINLGARPEWPNTVYYAAWDLNTETDRWDLWVGLREHMPEGWRRFVDGRPSVRRKRLAMEDQG